MYQIIVLGVGLSLLIGGAYYIKETDHTGLLAQTIVSNAPLVPEDIAGDYICDVNSGCSDTYTISFDKAGSLSIVAVADSGRQLLNEEGIWRFEKGGAITVIFSDSRTFLIQSVSTTTLTKLVYDAKLYPNMRKPIFSR